MLQSNSIQLMEEVKMQASVGRILHAIMIVCWGGGLFPIAQNTPTYAPFNYRFLVYISTYTLCGLLFRCLYIDRGRRNLIIKMIVFTSVGLLLRYYFEFGEQSTICNFTPCNIFLHITVATGHALLIYNIYPRFFAKK